MKIWISKNSEIPVHEQLVTQVALGIASGDLRAGDKLPSTREMARRFGIHANTVSAAYKTLAERRLINFRKGSGCYIAETNDRGADSGGIDRLVSRFVAEAAAMGYRVDDLCSRLELIAAAGARHFLIVEPDEKLREILMAEISEATGCDVAGISTDELATEDLDSKTTVVAMLDKKEKLAEIGGANGDCIFLEANSVAGNLYGKDRPSETDLIAIVSIWDRFLAFAKLYLVAAGIDPETIISRSPDEADWRRGLDGASLVICDTVVGKILGETMSVSVFPIISESSIAELKHRGTSDA